MKKNRMKIHGLYMIKIIKKDYKKKKACESLSTEGKETKWQYRHECSKNLPEDEKQKLIEYRKKYYKMRKNALL